MEQLSKDSLLWETFESGPNAVVLPASMKKVLTLMGYANVGALSRFSKDEFSEIEQFMRSDLIDLIEEKDVEMYYGIFKTKPEKYRLLGGTKLALLALAEKAQTLAKNPPLKKAPLKTSATSQSLCLPTSHLAPQQQEVHEAEHLSTIIWKWVQDSSLDVPDEEDKTMLSVSVTTDSFGNFKAILKCPKCEGKTLNCSKIKNKWNTSAIYKHLKKHIPKSSKTPVRTINDMFQGGQKRVNETSAETSGGEHNKRIRTISDENSEESSNESDQKNSQKGSTDQN